MRNLRRLVGAVAAAGDSTLAPAEIVLCVFEAPSVAAVRVTASRAGLRSERIVECVHMANRLLSERSGDA